MPAASAAPPARCDTVKGMRERETERERDIERHRERERGRQKLK